MAKDEKTSTKFDIDKLTPKFMVEPGSSVSLKRDFKTEIRLDDIQKDELSELLQDSVRQLAKEQDKLYAQSTYAMLVILQAMDAAGKDSTIKHVMSGVNPQGCQVYSFKAPSAEELDHDFLWRCMKVLPERGNIGIFNRSYYEEVLVTRVHPEFLQRQHIPADLMTKNIWKRRFEDINNFEKYLSNNGIVVVKFFLNVSKQEQKRRFLARIDRPDKNWKFSADDVRERRAWKQYIEAYEDCLSETSTKHAPWHVIPADQKAFMRLAVASIIRQKLESLSLDYPKITETQRQELTKAKELLLSEKD